MWWFPGLIDREMISHFWNLCRACPALDVDKVRQGVGVAFGRSLGTHIRQWHFLLNFRLFSCHVEGNDS